MKRISGLAFLILLSCSSFSQSVGIETAIPDNSATLDITVTNITAEDHTAVGTRSLFSNTLCDNNTASRFQLLNSNTVGNNNTATGTQSLLANATGVNNIAIGEQRRFAKKGACTQKK